MILGVLLALILLIIYGTDLIQWMRAILVKLRLIEPEIPGQVKVVPLEAPCPGLVVIMSPKADSPAEHAIRYHWNHGQDPHVQHCWIICTEKSLPFAQALHQQMLKEGIGSQFAFHYGNINNPQDPNQPLSLIVSDRETDDPDSVLQLVEAIYADAHRYGLSETDVIVDFTGGTKPMGVGACLACTRPSRRLEYITQTHPTRLIEIKVSYKLWPIKA